MKWEAAAAIFSIYLLVSLGGHGQVEPVENVVDLLALHLGLDTVGEEVVAGLANTASWATTCNSPPPKKKTNTLLLNTSRTLTSVLTCMTPSSVSVLVSITRMPSAESSAKIFWRQKQSKTWVWMNRQDVSSWTNSLCSEPARFKDLNQV